MEQDLEKCRAEKESLSKEYETLKAVMVKTKSESEDGKVKLTHLETEYHQVLNEQMELRDAWNHLGMDVRILLFITVLS